jgi:hypothetical protein
MFLWDEAERLIDVGKNDPSFIHALRGRLTVLKNFRFAVVGSQTLTEILPEDDHVSSFLLTFHRFPLGGLDDNAARRLIGCEQSPGTWTSPPPNAVVDEAIAWCGGHPLMLQHLGSFLFVSSADNGKLLSSQTLLQYFSSVATDTSLKRIFEDDQQRLTSSEHAVLRALCAAPEGIGRADLAAIVTGLKDTEADEAASHLVNYGYLNQDDRISLRFRFYTKFILGNPGESLADPGKIERIKPKLFISYSRGHREWLDRLLVPLKAVLRDRFEEWVFVDSNLNPSDEWHPKIQQALDGADIAVAIVTPRFFTSDYITRFEVPIILTKAAAGRFKLLCLFAEPTIVDSVVYHVGNQYVSLTKYLGLNDPRTPLSALSQNEMETELVRISKEILRRMYEALIRDATE